MDIYIIAETVAVLPQGSNGYRLRRTACAGEAAAKHFVDGERKRGFDSRYIETTEEEWNEVLAGRRNGWLAEPKLS